MRSLQDLRSLVALARKFGQEPSAELLEQIRVLEIDETQRLQREAKIRARVAEDLTELFNLRGEVHELVQSPPEQTSDTSSTVTESVTEPATFGISEAEPDKPIPVAEPTIAEKVAKVITEQGVVAPDPVLAQPQKDLEREIRYLREWVSRIAATGAGSGEVNFRYLDDVNRSTINDNWVLEYDAASKKFQFTKNVGPVETLRFDTSGTTQAPVAGQVHWNQNEDCLDVHQNDGTTLQVGMEQYIQVHNHTSSTLANGTVVRFAGVAEDYETAIVVPHIANGSIPPLYTVGVLTSDIATSSTGRATTLGKVRNLNTTGSDVGETWQVGDLLWLSTDNPGKMTKVKPTAPDIVVSIAAVLKVDATTGILLVRPTVWPRLYYGRFEHFGTISTTSINTSHAVTFTQTIVANGFYINSGTTSRIYAVESGFYDFEFSAQLVSSNASSKNFWMWARRNGTSSTTARRQTVVGSGVYTVVTCNFALSLEAGEYLEVLYAVDDSNLILESTPANAFAPAAPSVTITAMQVAL
jgi:hypothetical protein